MPMHRQLAGPPPPLSRPGHADLRAPLQPRMAKMPVAAFGAPARVGAPPQVGPQPAARAVQPRVASPLPPGPPPQPRAPHAVVQPRLALRQASVAPRATPAPPPGATVRRPPIQLRPATGAKPRAIQRASSSTSWDLRTPDRANIDTMAYNLAGSRSVHGGTFTAPQIRAPGKADLAATHVVPDAGIKHTITYSTNHVMGAEDPLPHLERMEKLVENAKAQNSVLLGQPDVVVRSKGSGRQSRKQTVHSRARSSSISIDQAYEEWHEAIAMEDEEKIEDAMQELHQQISTAPGNLPDYGLHSGFNQPVSDRRHLNVDASGRMTPISQQAAQSPVLNTPIAVSQHGNYLITRPGGFFPIAKLDPVAFQVMSAIGFDQTNIPSPRSWP